MKRRNTLLLKIIIAIQILILLFLGVRLYGKIHPSLSITTIDSKTLYRPTESKYAFFYDTKPNTNSIAGSVPAPEALNKDGLRDRYDYESSTASNTIRIVVLGDSHTYGMAVPVENIYTEVLEDLLLRTPICATKMYDVINLGMHGYDMLYAAERYRLKGGRYEPDVILWFAQDGDFQEHKDTEGSKIADFEARKKSTITVEEIIRIRDEYREEFGETLPYIQANAITELATTSEAKVLVFSGSEYFDRINYKIVSELIATLATVELFFPFEKIPDSHLFEDGHPNIQGHKFIAENLYTYLSEHAELLPCKE